MPFQYDGGGTVRTYDSEAFTDGTVYADTFAGLLQLDESYDNYAFGGAQALGSKLGESYINSYSSLTYSAFGGGSGTFSIVDDTAAALTAYGTFDINLGAQVDRYIEDNPGGAPPDTLAVLNIGANDLGEFDTSFFNILLGGVNAFADDLGDEVELQARRLDDAGVAGIALYTLPVAEFFIGYDDLNWLEAPVARDLIDAVNDEIRAAAQALNSDGIETQVVRLDIMAEELLSDMQSHGFLYQGPYLFGYSGDPDWVETSPGVIEPVFDVNGAATGYRAEQIMFFDEIHPSGALHDMLAVFSSESISTDEVFGSSGADIINLFGEDDFVIARGGSDEVNLGAGDDVAHGGTSNDTLRGEDGSDLLIGGKGGDSLEGGEGSDVLAGSAGNDLLSGGSEADMLIGGLGSDTVRGDGGNDVFIYIEESLWGGPGGSNDFYDGGDGEDVLIVYLASAVPPEPLTPQSYAFADGSLLSVENIETIVFHTGLPDDPDSPLATLSMPEDLQARYVEAELWGIV